MQILSVKTKDFKGIKLVEVVPTGGTTVIGGKNRAGKSSLLDSIAATLGGAKLCPKTPIREGHDSASCKVKLTGHDKLQLPACTVTRTWKRKNDGGINSTLEITTDAGHKVPSPQATLDRIVGQLGFDPERFLRMKPKDQADVLRELVGLDFGSLDAERQKVFDERTEVNRNGKAMKARFDAMPNHVEAPYLAVSVADLMGVLQRRQAVNRSNEAVRNELAELQNSVKVWDRQIESAALDVAEFEKRLKQAQDRLGDLKDKKATATGDVNVKSVEVNGLNDEDVSDIQNTITASEGVNRQVRENAERAKLEADLESERKKSAALSDRLEEIDTEKQKMRENAEWPVDGLGYNVDGVMLLDRPFEQASATEQREAAFGIVAALNPALKFSFIKDGSLLDEESLADFGRIAAENGFQLFVERVGDGKECTLVISDGEVVVPSGVDSDVPFDGADE